MSFGGGGGVVVVFFFWNDSLLLLWGKSETKSKKVKTFFPVYS